MSAGSVSRVLLVGWFSFLHGEATAGDVPAWQRVRDELERERIAHETAWSPGFRPGGPTLDAARPRDYSHLVFVCGPVHGPQVPARRTDRAAGGDRRLAARVAQLERMLRWCLSASGRDRARQCAARAAATAEGVRWTVRGFFGNRSHAHLFGSADSGYPVGG